MSENEDKFWLYVRRLYGINGTVSVDFDMTMTEPKFTRVEYRHATIWFDDQVEEVAIEFKVFKRPYYETVDFDTTFKVFLLYPTGGAEIGLQHFQVIRYFDDESITDSEFSYPVLEGVRPHATSEDLFYSLPL